ncbi:unnamed protein product [Effrenium voratum]|uniref:Uncharacterized protein n=1 Tax=Effrenium voratum TaxID=2562239 RepID=A0AA36N4C3_9DINO|nr:unnamed protein product [Effrenium voratum]
MAGQDSHRNPAQAESPSSDAKKGPPPEQLKELVDLPQLQRALRALGSGSQAQSLDSLDEDEDEAPEARLFREAFLEVAGAAESFQVFRSVVRLTPTAVLMQAEHRAVVLERLRDFAGTAAAPESRRSAQALGASLALREPGCAFEVFELLAAALAAVPASLGAGAADAPLSAAGLGQWRRVALADSAAAWNAALSGESKALGWLGATFADQELYKRYHLAMETAEKVLTGSDQEDWVLDKARYLRVESELRATRCRCASASLALLALRRTQTRQRARWGQQGGGLWRAFCSTLSTAQHTMEPPFVKPPPPAVLLYAEEAGELSRSLDSGRGNMEILLLDAQLPQD